MVKCPHCHKEIVKQEYDASFIKGLHLNAAYQHLDIDKELGKMKSWISVHPGRRLTKKFIQNWLNKAADGQGEVEVPSLNKEASEAFDKCWALVKKGMNKLPPNVSARGRHAVVKSGGLVKMGQRRESEEKIAKDNFIRYYIEYKP